MSDSKKVREQRARTRRLSGEAFRMAGSPVMYRITRYLQAKAFEQSIDLAGAEIELIVRDAPGDGTATRITRFALPKLSSRELRYLAPSGRLLHASRRIKLPPRDVPPAVTAITTADFELEQALKAARVRGQQRATEILAGNEMLSADAFGVRVGATRATINSWRKIGKVLGISGAKRGYRYPEWQIGADGRPLDGLAALHDLFGQSAWAVYRFLVQAHPELGGITGLESLARGNLKETLTVAESVAQGFA